jgi:hypothetical protein
MVVVHGGGQAFEGRRIHMLFRHIHQSIAFGGQLQ